MKKFIVDEKCTGCGQCVLQSNYLIEDASGNAKAIEGKNIADIDLELSEKLVSQCPCQALHIQEIILSNKKGTEGLNELLEKLSKEINSISIPKVTSSDVKFIKSDYKIDTPYCNKEYDAKFSSESQARNAARDELKRLCFSESAYRPMIKKIFVDYKVKVLKPYYTYEANDISFYHKYNQMVENKLKICLEEARRIYGSNFPLNDEWGKFEVYPAKGNLGIEQEINPVGFFEERSTRSGIMAEINGSGYSDINWHLDRIDYDYEEEYSGSGFFGSKTKKKWYFTGVNSEISDFVNDLLDAMTSAEPGIEGSAVDAVNSTISIYERKFKELCNKKIEEFKAAI